MSAGGLRAVFGRPPSRTALRPEPTYQFRHSLIQQATSKGLVRPQRRHLHSRAALGLEESAKGRLDEVAALLGHHYALAGDDERAARFLEQLPATVLRPCTPTTRLSPPIAGRWRCSGQAEMYWPRPWSSYGSNSGLCTGGSGVTTRAATRCGGRRRRWRLRMRRFWPPSRTAGSASWRSRTATTSKRGRPWTPPKRHSGTAQTKRAPEWAETWVAVQLSRSNLHYWRNECDLQLAVLEALRPVVEERAKAWQKADFYMHIAGQRWRAEGFAVDDRTISDVRAAWLLVAESGLDIENFHWQTLGFLLLLKGELARSARRTRRRPRHGPAVGRQVVRAGVLDLSGLGFPAPA